MICCGREACSCCGSDTGAEAHFVAGVLVCAACWCEIRSAPRPNTPPALQTQSSGQPMRQEIAFDGKTPKAKPQGAA
jgi:hypothetical protein